MQDVCCKLSRIAAMVVLVMAACVGSAWGQGGVPWQVGDVVVCYGTGSCNVIRIVGGTPTVLDSLSDAGFLGTGTPGFTYGAAIDDALHLLVTDGGSGTQSNIVKYSIASRNWLNNPSTQVAHTIIATFDGTVGGSGGGIRAVALDSGGHLFVGNSNPATIVEIDQNRPSGNGTASFPSGWRAFTQYPSNFIIIDANGNLQKVTTAGTSGSSQPIFGSSSTMDGTVTWTNQGSSKTPLGSFAVSNLPTTPAWQASFGYSLGAKVLDPDGHVQQVTTAGTSGTVLPAFNQFGGTATDALTWTNLGSPTTCPNSASSPYSVVHFSCIDPTGNVEEVTTAGTSGASQPPSWNSTIGGRTFDGSVVWTNRGPSPIPNTVWLANTDYLQPFALIFDGANIEEVTTVGHSGGSAPNPWGSSIGAVTVDNPPSPVVWTDQGFAVGQPCIENQLSSLDLSSDGTAVYFTSGPGGIVQKVTGLTSCNVVADFGPSVTLSGIRVIPPGALPATCSSPDQTTPVSCPSGESLLVVATGVQYVDEPCFACSDLPGDPASVTPDPAEFAIADDYIDICKTPQFPAGGGGATNGFAGPGLPNDSCALLLDINALALQPWVANHPYVVGNRILDPLKHVQIVKTPGTSAPLFHPTFNDSGSTAPDDPNNPESTLVWQDQGPAIIRYPVAVNTLQALTLGQLVTDCSANSCVNTPFTPVRKVSNFFVGDSASTTFYGITFASGTPVSYNVPAPVPPCTGPCNIQALGVYAGEGANQVGLASLTSGTVSSANNTLSAQFQQNSITTSLYGSNSSPTTISSAAASLYGSPVDESTCFNDGTYNAVNNTYSNNGLPCRQTTAAGAGPGLVWKIDIPTDANPPAALPSSEILATSFKTLPLPNGNGTTDFSTDVFVDMIFDTTVTVGNTDPTTKYTSVHSLHETPFSTTGGGGCSNTSPVPKQCFQSPNTIPFKFACTNFPKSSLGTLSPTLAIKQTNFSGQAGFPINLFGTNGSNNYRFTGGQWVFNWNVDGFVGTFNACTFDLSGQIKTFCVPFTVAKSCK